MKIEKNKVVSLSYVLSVNGETVEVVHEKKPMKFIAGTGYLLPKFEENITGLCAKDLFDFKLPPCDAYGEIAQEAIVELPQNIFEVNGVIEKGLLKIGNVLPMSDAEGNQMQGVIEKICETTVIMNFNHPLAGEELHFKGTVVDIRDATPYELLCGLHGDRLPQRGDCNCNSRDCERCNYGK